MCACVSLLVLHKFSNHTYARDAHGRNRNHSFCLILSEISVSGSGSRFKCGIPFLSIDMIL